MFLKIDVRESALYQILQQNISSIPQIELVSEQLPLGDIIICDETTEYLIIERKTLLDLSASIKDGRYEEQSYRLNGLPHHNHNIIFLIEGELNSFVAKSAKNRMDSSTIYSAMFSINYYKGFSLMRSKNIDETATIICNMCNKLKKDLAKGRKPYYSFVEKTTTVGIEQQQQQPSDQKQNSDPTIESIQEQQQDINESKKYCSVIKKNKKENITKENIGEIMLCQIPGVSSAIAIAILSEFQTLPNLIEQIKLNDKCMNNICTTDSNGKHRKISKTAISTIIEFLLN
jgi:ERCC4-type nuclease